MSVSRRYFYIYCFFYGTYITHLFQHYHIAILGKGFISVVPDLRLGHMICVATGRTLISSFTREIVSLCVLWYMPFCRGVLVFYPHILARPNWRHMSFQSGARFVMIRRGEKNPKYLFPPRRRNFQELWFVSLFLFYQSIFNRFSISSWKVGGSRYSSPETQRHTKVRTIHTEREREREETKMGKGYIP